MVFINVSVLGDWLHFSFTLNKFFATLLACLKHTILKKGEGKENKILEEFQKGYMLKERILRHSKVKVSE